MVVLIVIFLGRRLSHVLFGRSFDFFVLLVVLSSARFRRVVIRVVLFHLLVDILVGVGLVARRVALLVVVVIVVLGRVIYM